MAFDNEDYLKAWKMAGLWPDIHDELFDLVSQTYTSSSVCDLCSSIGILGQQIHDRLAIAVCGVEMNQSSIDRGLEWGITVPTLCTRVDRATMDTFIAWLLDHGVTGIVARRCFSDVFGGTTEEGPLPAVDYELADLFCDRIRSIGVTEVWLQGRAWSKRATHPIPHTQAEIDCLTHGGRFKVAERSKNCAWLLAAD